MLQFKSRFAGPVAQLGARFHGMEEVKGSNPFRSTNSFRLTRNRYPFSSLTWKACGETVAHKTKVMDASLKFRR